MNGDEVGATDGSGSDAVSDGDPVTGHDETAPARPLLRIVRGDPSPEEVAALVTVLAARSAGTVEDAVPTPSPWSRPAAAHSRPLTVGPGAWRLSATDPQTRTRADW